MKYVFLLFSSLVVGASAFANECDPAVILSKDKSVSFIKNEVALAYAKLSSEGVARSDTQSLAMKFPIKGIPVDVGLSTASAFASFVQTQIGYTYAAEEYRYFLDEYLSENAVEAYKACLNQRRVRIEVDKGAYRSDTTLVTVHWNGDAWAPENAKVKVITTNGVVSPVLEERQATIGSQSAEQDIAKGGSALFLLSQRTVAKMSQISAIVYVPRKPAREQDQIVLPAFIPYEVVLTSQEVGFIPHLEGPRFTLMRDSKCITGSGPRGMLIPETASIEGTFVGGSDSSLNSDNIPARVCGVITARKSDAPHTAWVTKAKLSVMSVSVVKAVDRTPSP